MSATDSIHRHCSMDFYNIENICKAASVFNIPQKNENRIIEYGLPLTFPLSFYF